MQEINIHVESQEANLADQYKNLAFIFLTDVKYMTL